MWAEKEGMVNGVDAVFQVHLGRGVKAERVVL